MKIKVYIIFIFILMLKGVSYAQQTPIYSQYMMNSFLLNPAVAGAEGFTAFNVTAREQWLGFDNAPRTYSLSAQSRILKSSYLAKLLSIRNRTKRRRPSGKVGVGAYLYSDKNGAISRTGGQFSYAYHLYINNSQLSFGLAASFFQLKADIGTEDLYNPDDPLVNGNKNTLFVPDANFGVYYYNISYYVGFSAVQLLQSAIKFGDGGETNYRMISHYNLLGGYNFDLKNDFAIEPSVLLKTTENLTFQADINVKGYYRSDYWLGVSYRTSGAMVFMLGLKVDKYHFGYAFDYSMNDMSKYSYGSHEIMFGVKFGDNRRRYRWLNRF